MYVFDFQVILEKLSYMCTRKDVTKNIYSNIAFNRKKKTT